ncbi:Dihydrofolate reductase [Penicillium lividum]|nr:Dihydrofolate reductase [Penicillium lividum]
MLPPKTHSISPSLPLTLIVATTPIRIASTPTDETRLGIGLKGTLPWPRIKADMSFFARVTSRAPRGTTNAIIMGRKTYDSVPKHLRPLAKRISVVITRDTSGSVREGVLQELEARKAKMAANVKAVEVAAGAAEEPEPITDAIVTPSLDAALSELDSVYGAGLGKIFVIGGAEIYGAALRMQFDSPRPVRVVMTNVVRKGEDGVEVPFECDTFWPLDGMDERNGWRSASPEELTEWVGEEVSGEWKREGEVEVQMVGFEKLD